MSRRFTLFAVALPVIAIVLGIVRAEWTLRHGRDFVFEIGGYDPRDLLRGHYLLFSLRVDPLAVREPCEDDAPEVCCLCLTRGDDNRVTSAERASCATARADCDGALQISDAIRSVRYYVPEAHATELERRLREATQREAAFAVVSIDADGNGRVRELQIDGETIPGGVER
jgi:uncharacterized membrane-anchored protein